MAIKEVTEFAKNYLRSKNINFEKKCENDECSLIIKKINDVFYVESHCCYYKGSIGPEDKNYNWVFEGSAMPISEILPSYRFVCDDKGNIIVDLAEISRYKSGDNCIRLNQDNILLAIKDENRSAEVNKFQHFRVINGKYELINTLEGKVNSADYLLKNNLIVIGNKLYNFDKCVFTNENMFDNIFTGAKGDYGQIYNLDLLAQRWKIPYQTPHGLPGEQRQKFVADISKKMRKENLVGGFKIVQAKLNDFTLQYHTLVFLDTNGNFVSDLYYVDGYDLKNISNVTSQNYQVIIKNLECELMAKANEIVEEKEKQKKIFHNIKEQFKI